jgi:aryl-alcohol dehydrogenase-like predicted oxidoreductase
MDYVRFGETGIKVSRLCLGMMTYGTPRWRPWVLDEEQSRPFIKRAVEHGINFFDTADMYSLGVSGRSHRPRAQGLQPPRSVHHRHQGLLSDRRRAQRSGAVAQAHLRLD